MAEKEIRKEDVKEDDEDDEEEPQEQEVRLDLSICKYSFRREHGNGLTKQL